MNILGKIYTNIRAYMYLVHCTNEAKIFANLPGALNRTRRKFRSTRKIYSQTILARVTVRISFLTDYAFKRLEEKQTNLWKSKLWIGCFFKAWNSVMKFQFLFCSNNNWPICTNNYVSAGIEKI